MTKFLASGVVIALAFAIASCHKPNAEPSGSGLRKGGKPTVFTANYPLQYFAQRIGGAEVDVVFPAPKDIDPAFWQPTDDQIAALQDSDLIILNGATFSKWAEKVTLPEAKVVDTATAFKDRFIVVKNAVTHSHGKQGEHSHDGTSFTTWIDFQQAILQATAVEDALKKLLPGKAEMFAKNFEALKSDLNALDVRMLAVGKSIGGKPIVASHPIYQYWARRYEISLEAVLWEPEEAPTDEQMEGLKKILATHPAKWMVWEGEPAKESVAKLAAIGVSGVVFDPCSNVPDKGDFLSVMQANVTRMEQMAGK
jgi:zinc transport system substrate-binding protein